VDQLSEVDTRLRKTSRQRAEEGPKREHPR
jgi:hypothetical protein